MIRPSDFANWQEYYFTYQNILAKKYLIPMLEQWGVSIDIARINPETKKFSFIIHQKELQQEFIILKAIVFPYINLVWLGGIITFLGIFISAWRRRS